MKLNQLTPNIVDKKNVEVITKKAQEVVKPLVQELSENKVPRRFSHARATLELNAENMSANEYIEARRYLASMEFDEMFAAEMKYLK